MILQLLTLTTYLLKSTSVLPCVVGTYLPLLYTHICPITFSFVSSYDVKSQQINLDVELVTRAGAWCNKIWQVARLLHLTHGKVW